jgi:glycosyltransferase involved in cell wall biosynthesis
MLRYQEDCCTAPSYRGEHLKPFVSIVVPLLNEAPYIEGLTRSFFEQTYPPDRFEILMADGGCTDDTIELLRKIDPDNRIRVLDNPGRTAPAALNVLISAARGEIITRVDAHSRVAPDYLEKIVQVMEETGESVVGGPVLMDADTPFRRALVQALYSRIGVGSVPYRTLRRRAYVESLQTGSFRSEVFDKVGLWDESLAVVEDLDMNTRIIKAGYRLLLDPAIRFWYYPRPGTRALWKQIFTVGRVKAWILEKHPEIFKLKYVLPSLFVLGMLCAPLCMIAGTVARFPAATWIGGGCICAYMMLVLLFSAAKTVRVGADAVRLLVILPILHFGYGLGFLLGLSELPSRRRKRALN